MSKHFVQRMINFEIRDYQAVKDLSSEYGLGKRGYSAAVRLIIREWLRYRSLYNHQLESLAAQPPIQQPSPIGQDERTGEPRRSPVAH